MSEPRWLAAFTSGRRTRGTSRYSKTWLLANWTACWPRWMTILTTASCTICRDLQDAGGFLALLRQAAGGRAAAGPRTVSSLATGYFQRGTPFQTFAARCVVGAREPAIPSPGPPQGQLGRLVLDRFARGL